MAIGKKHGVYLGLKKSPMNIKMNGTILLGVVLLGYCVGYSSAKGQSSETLGRSGYELSTPFTFIGTVSLVRGQTRNGFKWIVAATVDRILSGEYSDDSILLSSHDWPAACLKVGKQYRILAQFGRHGWSTFELIDETVVSSTLEYFEQTVRPYLMSRRDSREERGLDSFLRKELSQPEEKIVRFSCLKGRDAKNQYRLWPKDTCQPIPVFSSTDTVADEEKYWAIEFYFAKKPKLPEKLKPVKHGMWLFFLIDHQSENVVAAGQKVPC